MPRKRKTTPYRMSDEKRKCLTWNMLADSDDPSHPSSAKDETETHSLSDAFSLATKPLENVQSTELIDQQYALHRHEISHRQYKALWDAADYSISILDKPPPNSVFKLGTFTLRLSPHSLKTDCCPLDSSLEDPSLLRTLPSHNKFSLFVVTANAKREFYIVFDSDSNDENVNSNRPYICLDALFEDGCKDAYLDGLEFLCRVGKGKLFSLTKSAYCAQKSLLNLDVWITESALKKPKFGAESYKRTQCQKSVQCVMEWLQGIHIGDIGCAKRQRQDFDQVFSFVRQFHKEEDKEWLRSVGDVQHENLVPKLREYQKEAVQWMIKKEKLLNENTKENDLHCLWRELDCQGTPLYYNANSGTFTHVRFAQPEPFPGGILADEMGLGKTVEVLALILNHKRPTQNKPKEKVEAEDVSPPMGNGADPVLALKTDNGIMTSNNMDTTIVESSDSERIQNRSHSVGKPAGSGDPVSICEHVSCGELASTGELVGIGEPVGTAVSGEPTGSVEAASSGVCMEEPVVTGDPAGSVQPASIAEPASTEPFATGEPASSGSTAEHPASTGESASSGEPSCTDEPQKLKNLHCVCGVIKDTSGLVVQCVRCKIWQHTRCVNINTNVLDREHYHCPHCWSFTDAVQSSATLIITPAAICHQWVDEINRHINLSEIKMLIYQGIKKHGYIQPKDLASYDIVITTYDKLRSELNYVDLPHTNEKAEFKFRHAKRYMATPSPLPYVEWWRVCLDEAQMIESTTAKSAAMALRLITVNRWCVTGTPIQRSMDDLYGLFSFIGVEPYWVKCWWEQVLCRPFYVGNMRPIQEAVAKVLWRTSKKDVIDQINLPPQTEERHWLKFSPVEQHFYKRQHIDCSGRFMKAFNHLRHADLSIKLCDVDQDTVQKLLHPLLHLRQACCHPQAVRGQFIPLQKDFLTMDQLLASLQEKAKIESEECHRQLVCALNGLAAVHVIKAEIVEAIAKYREVLQSSQEFVDKLRTDKLQLYHAMVNLRKLLDIKLEGVDPTLRDHQLEEMASEIYDGYMAKALVKVKSAEESLKPVQERIDELAAQVPIGCTWWAEAIDLFQDLALDDDITKKVKDDLDANATPGVVSLGDRFRNLPGLQFLLVRHVDLLNEKRTAVCEAVAKLTCDPNTQLLQQCIECHLRPFKGEEQKTCPFCEADQGFTDYEIQLFAFNFSNKKVQCEQSTKSHSGEHNRHRRQALQPAKGTWAMSEIERILRTLLSCCKNLCNNELVEIGTTHIETLESYRKEFKLLRGVWMALRDRVAAMDELEMCTMRLRVRLPWEPADPSTENYVIEPGQVDLQYYKLFNDHAMASNELRKKLSQQLYLSNLATSDYSKQGQENPEQCPICVTPLGYQWTVLQCGHCFCYECIAVLMKNYSSIGRRKSIKCATCRSPTLVEDISYVSTRLGPQDLGMNVVKVKGGHSTKVEAVIRTLLTIQKQQPGVKSIVFSTWTDVLDVIAHGLRDNDIKYHLIQYGGHSQFQEKLNAFKYDEQVLTLLLPVQSGAKGLNIIEATHVLLVEPILNVANELQAIGRVHRIGQTKPTVVHRFLIQNTIEERIHAMLQTTHNASVDSTELELGGLSLHDLKDIFDEIL